MIKIVIVDGQDVYRNELQVVLSNYNDFKIIGIGKDGYDAIKLTVDLHPDIVLMDIHLPLIDGVTVASILKYRSPATSVIIMTNFNNKDYVQQAICNGVAGYLVKETDRDYLAAVIRAVYNGDCFLSPKIVTGIFRYIFSAQYKTPLSILQNNKVQLADISDLEILIVSYIGQGFSNKEIAEKLKLKAGTVRNHISSILQKTKLRDRTQIAIHAVTHGFTSNDSLAGEKAAEANKFLPGQRKPRQGRSPVRADAIKTASIPG
jgi:DNA-binding NarL/FixJ family response regulator